MNRDMEAVLLTGGASRRMGRDKASLVVEGGAMAVGVLEKLDSVGIPVTVSGREPIEERPFLPDAEIYAGPAAALSKFKPSTDHVFVVACDLPLLDPQLPLTLEQLIGDHQAALPFTSDRRQMLCGLYTADAFTSLSDLVCENPSPSMWSWTQRISVREVTEDELSKAGINPRSTLGANTLGELSELLGNTNEQS
jgi:molybdopterin-guanine dinucleotide biosynthesis protein A